MTSVGLTAWLPGFALAGMAGALAATGREDTREVVTVLSALGVLLVWGISMTARKRYPDRPLWIPLSILAVAFSVQPAIYSVDPVLFAVGRAVRPGMELLLIWVMLAFPTGFVRGRMERWVLIFGVATLFLLWLPGVMLAPRVPQIGASPNCLGECPENLFSVMVQLEWSERFISTFRVAGIALMAMTFVLLASRWMRASRLMRRSLAPVVLTSLLRTVGIAAFLSVGLNIWLRTLSLWAVPAAILLGLLLGRLYTARALHRLVTGLRTRPAAGDLRNVMAEALEDPSLEVGYWHNNENAWFDAQGRPISLSIAEAQGRAIRILHGEAVNPVAVLVFDPALLEEPRLLDAVVSSMQGAIVSHQLEESLIAERVHSATAAEEERRRIERDLHDGAQQRLLAMRMKIGVMRRLMENNPARATQLMQEMDGDIAAAIAELRALSHGLAPPVLVERGLDAALREVAAQAALPVKYAGVDVGRLSPEVERAVYFCCVEALQNAAKHAGLQANVLLSLSLRDGCIEFAVKDNGAGAEGAAESGRGIRNMRERLEALGGTLRVDLEKGAGACVTGSVPLAVLTAARR